MDVWSSIFTLSTLAVVLTKIAPLLLAAIGGAITQMGNILNIGLEGMMLIAAFTSVVAGHYLGNPFLGVLAGVLAALLMALLYGLVSLNLKADFIVVGIGINLLALGLTVLLLQVFFGNPGVTPPTVKSTLPRIDLGPVGDIPILGPVINNQSPLVWLAFLSVPLYAFVLYRTRYGVHLRAVGEDVEAARAAGINEYRVKMIAILASGVMCGLAGSQLAMGALGSFTANMTANRGFIAVAALTFGLARPGRTMVACIIFGAADAIADRLGIAGINSALALMTPYIITLVALVFASLRVKQALNARSKKALASVATP